MSCEKPAVGAENSRRASPILDGIDPGIEEYASILRANLKGDFRPFAEFFSDPRRLEVMARLLSQHFSGPPGVVLNAGCGPFPTEFFVQSLQRHRVVSFDYTKAFAPVYPALRARGHLSNTAFFIGNVLTVEFLPETFDLIIMQDLLYEPALDLFHLFRKYDRFLCPGGLFFLTVLDARTHGLWRLLGQEKPSRRYDISRVLAHIQACGYQVVDCVPWALHGRGLLGSLFKKVLWHGFGLANEHAIMARKTAA